MRTLRHNAGGNGRKQLPPPGLREQRKESEIIATEKLTGGGAPAHQWASIGILRAGEHNEAVSVSAGKTVDWIQPIL